jgi:hypothetical protein
MIAPPAKHFPTICVDGFYDDPDSVLEYALSLEYKNDADTTGYYPGNRTKPLHILNPELFRVFSERVFSLYYDLEHGRPVTWNIYTAFHKIPMMHNDPDNLRNVGWIHGDGCLAAGVIYLNKTAAFDSGTSIYKMKDEYKNAHFQAKYDTELAEKKMKLFKQKTPQELQNRTAEEDEAFIESVKANNDMFIETAKFQNVFNRMIAYDGEALHAANRFHCIEEPFRLTQVFFIHEMESFGTPLQRMRKRT